MPVILLIRHGQASFGSRDYDRLSLVGHEQSRLLGEALKQRGGSFDVACRGEMRRHRETAESCLGAFGARHLGLRIDPRLNEFDPREMIRRHDPLGFNLLWTAAKTVKDRQARKHFEQLFTASMLRWTGGKHDGDYDESWPAFARRCNAAIDELAGALNSGDTALVFTSGGPIGAIAQRCLGLGGDQVPALAQSLVNGGVTKLLVGKRGLRLSTLNEHTPFEADAARLLTYR